MNIIGDLIITKSEEESIGSLIRTTRRACGMSQYVLAAELVKVSGNDAMNRTRVARWERGGRIPDPYWRGWLSDVLKLPQNQLDRAARIAYAHRSCRSLGPELNGTSAMIAEFS